MVLSRVHNVLLVLSMHIVTDVTKQRTHVILFSIMMGADASSAGLSMSHGTSQSHNRGLGSYSYLKTHLQA